MSDSLWPQGLHSPWNSPGQKTGVGSLSLLQRIFATGLPHCRQILHQLSHKESPRILEWVAYPFSSGSSQPRNQTRISCIVGRFFTSWATREAHVRDHLILIYFIRIFSLKKFLMCIIQKWVVTWNDSEDYKIQELPAVLPHSSVGTIVLESPQMKSELISSIPE